MPTETRTPGAVGRALIGVSLVLIGVLWMVGQMVDLDVGDWWPLFIIVPGLVVAAWGITLSGGGRTAALVVSFQLVGLGGLLWIQQAFDLWPTWAYAWALLWPGTIGAAIWTSGRLEGDLSEAANGRKVMSVGIVIFAVGFVFFEGVLGISGDALPLSDLVVPLVLVGLGVLLLVPGLRRRSRTPR